MKNEKPKKRIDSFKKRAIWLGQLYITSKWISPNTMVIGKRILSSVKKAVKGT